MRERFARTRRAVVVAGLDGVALTSRLGPATTGRPSPAASLPPAPARHLVTLQQIADENAGNRASPGPGYEASVRYVVAVL